MKALMVIAAAALALAACQRAGPHGPPKNASASADSAASSDYAAPASDAMSSMPMPAESDAASSDSTAPGSGGPHGPPDNN